MDQVIGREAELSAIDRLLARASQGVAGLVLLGEPGIGKTTLWTAARQEASARGFHVLWARPAEAESGLPLGAFGDLFTSVNSALVDALPGPQRDAVRAALLLAEPSGVQSAQRALAVATLSLLSGIAALGHPVLLALDDVQWLDKSSAAALAFALRRVQSQPIAVMAALRGGGDPPAPLGLESAVEGHRLERCRLGPLSLAALHRLLAERLDVSFPRLALLKIEAASRGNPFYALEIARTLIRTGSTVRPGQPLPIPDALTSLTVERVAALPARTREALLVAAVAFEPSIEDLSRAAGADLAVELAPAMRDGIVVMEGEMVRFSHPLLASAVLARAEPARIRALHSALAATVRADEARARHMGLATDVPDEGAAEALETGAERARLRGAPLAAAEMLERARELTPRELVDDAARRDYLAAQSYAEGGERTAAAELLERLLGRLPDGVGRARALQLLGQVRAWSASFPEALALALAALQHAAGDEALMAEIELDIVFYSISLGDMPNAEAHARVAVRLGESTGPDGLYASSLAILTVIDFFAGRGVDEARLDRALALDDPHRVAPPQMKPRLIRALLLLFTGRLDEARAILVEEMADAVDRGHEGTVPMISFYLVWACVWRGDVDAAVAVGETSREVAFLNDDAAMQALALAATSLAYAVRGTTERARADADRSLLLMQQIHWTLGAIWPLWAAGLLETSLERHARVDALLRPIAEIITTMEDVDPILGSFLPEEVEALVSLGDVERAARYTAWLDRGASRLNRVWAAASAARCRGLIAAAGGEFDAALNELEDAAAQHRRADMPLELARTLLIKGQVHRRRKEKRPATETLQEALRIFEAAGARVWASRARDELARVSQRPHASDVLTTTERRVADLAAAGLANREIAKRAFLTTKSVEANLTRVYRKLGIRSRGGLARALQAEGTHRDS